MSLNEKYEKYRVIKQFYKTEDGEVFLVKDTENKSKEENFYILNKIEIKTKEKKIQIEDEIKFLQNMNSKYIMKIIEKFIIYEQEKEFICIILNYYEYNLSDLIYNTNFLNSRNVWKIFIQIILGLIHLNSHNIMPGQLLPQNIFLDKDNNIKIGGFNIVLNLTDKSIPKIFILPYISPEILKGEKDIEKSIIWSAGCILYEMALKKPAFGNDNYEKGKKNIIEINYNLPNDCERELCIFLPKLICDKKRRLSIKEIIFEGTFKNKIIEVNLFSEFITDKVKDFNKYFSINVGIFNGKEASKKFQNIELNEFPFYLICKKCDNIPFIELLKDNDNLSISCSKCNIIINEKIEKIVNYSSKWVTSALKLCEGYHKEIIPSTTYCKSHNLFLCKDCLKLHQEYSHFFVKNITIKDNIIAPKKDEIINVMFRASSGSKIALNISNKTSVKKALEILVKKFILPNTFIDEILFIFNGKMDTKSEKSLKEYGISNNSEILMVYNQPDDSIYIHEFIELHKLTKSKRNNCFFHKKKLNKYCIKCNMIICDECITLHKNHFIDDLYDKILFIRKDFQEFENIINRNENNKRLIYEKVEHNITWLENYKQKDNDLNDDLNELIKKMLTKFYKNIEKGQNLLFLSKILLATYIRLEKKDEKINQYKHVINIINNIFLMKKK